MLQEGHHRIFHPPLPARKQEAVAKLAIGVVDKLFIRFHCDKHQAADGDGAAGTTAGRSVLSYQLLWKVCSSIGNAGFNPTTQPATGSAAAGGSAAGRSVLSHQLLWKVCMSCGTAPPHPIVLQAPITVSFAWLHQPIPLT